MFVLFLQLSDFQVATYHRSVGFLQWDWGQVDFPLIKYLNHQALFWVGLGLDKGGDDCTSRLENLSIVLNFNLIDGLMLMAPNGQIHPGGYMLGVDALQGGCACFQALLVPVLMKDKQTEILILIIDLYKLNLPVLKQLIQDGILNVAQAINCHFHAYAFFLNDHWLDHNLCQICMLAKIVGVVTHMQQITYRQLAKIIRGVVMIAMNGKYRELDVHVLVLEVYPIVRVLGVFGA